MPISCCAQVDVGQARPGSGRIRPRSQVAGPKMNRLLLGWLRPVRLREGRQQARGCGRRPRRPARSSRSSPSAWRSSRSGWTGGTPWPCRGTCRRPAPAPRSPAAATGCRSPRGRRRTAPPGSSRPRRRRSGRRPRRSSRALMPGPAGPEPRERRDVDRDAVPLHPRGRGHVAAPEQGLAERHPGVALAFEDRRQHRAAAAGERAHVGGAVVEQRLPLARRCRARRASRAPACPSSRRRPSRPGRTSAARRQAAPAGSARPFVSTRNSAKRSSTRAGSGQPSARKQPSSAEA